MEVKLLSAIDEDEENIIIQTKTELINKNHGYNEHLPSTFTQLTSYMIQKWGFNGFGDLVRVRSSNMEEIVPKSMVGR